MYQLSVTWKKSNGRRREKKKHVVHIISTYREHQARANTRANETEFLSRHTDDANQRRQKVVTRERPVSRQAVTETKVKISERQFDGRA